MRNPYANGQVRISEPKLRNACQQKEMNFKSTFTVGFTKWFCEIKCWSKRCTFPSQHLSAYKCGSKDLYQKTRWQQYWAEHTCWMTSPSNGDIPWRGSWPPAVGYCREKCTHFKMCHENNQWAWQQEIQLPVLLFSKPVLLWTACSPSFLFLYLNQ